MAGGVAAEGGRLGFSWGLRVQGWLFCLVLLANPVRLTSFAVSCVLTKLQVIYD